MNFGNKLVQTTSFRNYLNIGVLVHPTKWHCNSRGAKNHYCLILTQDSQSESNEPVNFIERMDLSHYSSLVLKMGVRRAGSSLVPKRANCQVLESFQDLSLELCILSRDCLSHGPNFMYFAPFLKTIFLFSRKFFQKILSLCIVSVKEQFVIKSSL